MAHANKDKKEFVADCSDRTLYHLPPLPSHDRGNWNSQEDDYDLNALVETLETDGVVVIPNVYSQDQIDAFRKQHTKNFRKVQGMMSKVTTPEHKPYRHDFDKKRYFLMPHYDVQDEDTGEWHEVIEISPGRLDYTYGMNDDDDDDDDDSDDDDSSDDDSDETNIFGSTEFQRPKILAELMDRMLKADYKSYAGALPSAGKSNDGPWHRDTYLLFDDERVDIALPFGYYYTVLIPLVPVTTENGATEFIRGSHKMTCKDSMEEKDSRAFQACIEPGSMVVFDGRICHRGLRNLTDANRTVLYMVWTKMWYDDY